jgi:hypothetical protein
MSETMRVKLIQSKILIERSNKLCKTISCTADFLARRTSPELYEGYAGSLVRLAAKSMIYWDLINCLHTAHDTQISSREIRENALVAAAEANRHELVEELLVENVSIVSNTRYFGEVFAAAASSGSLSMVLILLQNWNWKDRNHLSSARYIHAVQAAAWAGYKDIVLTLLDRGTPFTKSSYDDVVVRTAKTSQVSITEILLSRRQQHSDLEKERAFWTSLIRTTVEWNNRELLRHLVLEYLSNIEEGLIKLAVEDGCRKGHYEIVLVLVSALPITRARETAILTGGLFWVARSGTLENLECFLKLFQQGTRHITRALAGAIQEREAQLSPTFSAMQVLI